jgi:hypothetical protein
LIPVARGPNALYMEWKWHLRRAESPLEPTTVEESVDALRLFPIVGPDLCYPVAALLARGHLEEAAELVSDRAWVASAPLYG